MPWTYGLMTRRELCSCMASRRYKSGQQQLVIATPEIRVERLCAADEFLLLASPRGLAGGAVSVISARPLAASIHLGTSGV